jgi:PKD repeat protein
MKHDHIPRAFIVSLLIAVTFLDHDGYTQTFHRDYLDGHLYVKFRDDVRVDIPVNPDRTVNPDHAPFLDELRKKYEITGLSRPFDLNNDLKLLQTFEVTFSIYEKIEAIKDELMKNQDIEYVENVPLPYISYTPDDSLYNRVYGFSNWNWHLDVINAEMAWEIEKGSPEINIAIVDNAVWVDHPDLANKIVLSEDITLVGNQNSNPPLGGDHEDWSHGTHCAGLAGAHTDNLIGVASIGYNVSLIGVKASTVNPINITYGYAGLDWAANNGADIISMSWGGPGYSQTNQNLINTVHSMGIVMVAAAGNENQSTIQYPAGYNYVIGVASTDEDDGKSDFSNYGNWVDVSAPGGIGTEGPGGLMSTTWDSTSYGYYDTYPGTSMACPLVAGLCGLILSVNPDLAPDEVEYILESSCDDIYTVAGNENYAGQLGAGRINAFAAVVSTPFEPVADFSTPVQVILPGSSIRFYDMSVGIPDTWSWEFMGGSPHLSSQQNPLVTYPDEGIFTVYLGVTNDFGNDVETKTSYITVTSTPTPWIIYTASTGYACNYDTVIFTDESLYGPTEWTWTFEPSTVSFMDNTTMNSQNPHVRFEAPGFYTVTLTAANANGSSSKTTVNMIFIEGIPVSYGENFESGISSDFVLSYNSRAKANIDTRAAASGSVYGLHFQGYPLTGGWSGGPSNTTPDQAWYANTDFHAFADICSVDATGTDNVSLSFDLRQTYSSGNKFSWFRVMVNGEQVEDINGITNFNPVTNTDPFVNRTFDLSDFGNSRFTISLQSACYFSDKFYAEGDNAFVDNILVSNTTSVSEESYTMAGALTYPNPVSGILNFSARGAGEKISVEVLNMQGQALLHKTINAYREGDISQVSLYNFESGIYILKICGDKGFAVKKIIVD